MAAKPGSAPRKRLQPAPEAGSEPPLSRERIASTAIELLDAHGVDGFSMRRLADRLGSGVMSLYWHVSNKEDVFDLALDTVLEYRGPPPLVTPPEWRTEIIHVLEDWRTSMLRHPWSASLLPRCALGQNTLARLELLGKTLSSAGVAEEDLNVAIWSLWNYVMGATLTRASFELSDNNRATTQQRLADLNQTSYPTIDRSRLLSDSDWDGAFRKGLAFLLDGLAAKRNQAGGSQE